MVGGHSREGQSGQARERSFAVKSDEVVLQLLLYILSSYYGRARRSEDLSMYQNSGRLKDIMTRPDSSKKKPPVSVNAELCMARFVPEKLSPLILPPQRVQEDYLL